MALRTDYKDDILDISKNEKRKYNMIPNSDGTVSFDDVTEYSQKGDSFGAGDVNSITQRVNDGLGNNVEFRIYNGQLQYRYESEG